MSLQLPRFLARLLAALFGYFWLPCDICGRYEAGFEWDGRCWYRADGRGPGHGFCRSHPYRSLVLFDLDQTGQHTLYDEANGHWLTQPLGEEGPALFWWPNPAAKPTGLHLRPGWQQ